MTPAAGSDLIMSRVTIAALADLGYSVDYSEAEPFDSTYVNPKCVCDPGLLRGRSLMPATNTTRQLSDEGLERAMAYGRMQLSQNQNSNNLGLIEMAPDGVQDLGQEVIYVLYSEDETIHRVMVTTDDLS